MDDSLNKFYIGLMEDVQTISEKDPNNWTKEDFLTSVILDYLEEAGETSDSIMCPFRDRGLQLNAYAISEDFSALDLFVTIASDSETPKSVSQTEIDAAIKRAIQVYQKATNDLHASFAKDNEAYEFAITIKEKKNELKTVRICALTNGLVRHIELKNIILGNVDISFIIWDIERLHRCVSSGKMRETIEIDFERQYGVTIPCIENNTSKKYSVYLAIINGDFLAKIYDDFRDRLLEKNVRSFLQVKGSVNKGIRDTLRDEPDMFLAYNNGISVTAESVVISRDDNGKPSIKSIRDMQIVNGGQTTASIFNAYKDKKMNVDLSKVFVQMKLSVISSSSDMDEIVPRISAFANTQNKIQMADFSANDPYHRKIEDLSRSIWTPNTSGSKPKNWFYERARGQYADMLSRETTPLRKRIFKEEHPLFTKTDLAKYENTWDQLPFYVSEGAQKNFRRFTLRLNERKNFIPDEEYYRKIIAKAILFKETEHIVQQQQYGGYRANIVTYTIALLSFKTAQRINLEEIWQNQGISNSLKENIITASALVKKIITTPPGNANIGEWSKKEKCWEIIKECPFEISKELTNELAPMVKSTVNPAPTSSINSLTQKEEDLIDCAAKVDAQTWFRLSAWAKSTNNFQPWIRSLLFTMGRQSGRGKIPSIKQAKYAMEALSEAKNKGFS